MACCCKPGNTKKATVSCLGRCDLPKHRCLDAEHVKPGPVPRYMGWLYTARDAPEHQLRCGWRPGHISCAVLKKIEQHNCRKSNCCAPCSSCPSKPRCSRPCSRCCMPTPSCVSPCKTCPSSPCDQPLIRIIRHGGQYSICTKPSNLDNSPAGPHPLKYVLDTDDAGSESDQTKYSIEAKFNDYQFDYTSSTTSFVLDFTPPEPKCYKPCYKRSIPCMP